MSLGKSKQAIRFLLHPKFASRFPRMPYLDIFAITACRNIQSAVMKQLLVSALLAMCALFLIPCTPTFAFDSSYRAKAMAFLAQDIADARRSGSSPKVFLDLVDLNGDGIPEALARIESQYSCGSHGCAAYVLDLSGPTARSIGDFIAFSLKVLPTKTGAWRDVSLDGTKQVFQAAKYVSVATAPVAAAPLVQDRAKHGETVVIYGEPLKEEPCRKTGIPDSNHTWNEVKAYLPPAILATPKTPMNHDAILAALKKLSDENSTRTSAALKRWEPAYEAKHPDKNLMNLIDAFNDGKGTEALAGLDANKVNPREVAKLQKQIDQGQALYCVYSAIGGK